MQVHSGADSSLELMYSSIIRLDRSASSRSRTQIFGKNSGIGIDVIFEAFQFLSIVWMPRSWRISLIRPTVAESLFRNTSYILSAECQSAGIAALATAFSAVSLAHLSDRSFRLRGRHLRMPDSMLSEDSQLKLHCLHGADRNL